LGLEWNQLWLFLVNGPAVGKIEKPRLPDSADLSPYLTPTTSRDLDLPFPACISSWLESWKIHLRVVYKDTITCASLRPIDYHLSLEPGGRSVHTVLCQNQVLLARSGGRWSLTILGDTRGQIRGISRGRLLRHLIKLDSLAGGQLPLVLDIDEKLLATLGRPTISSFLQLGHNQ
jgi:hypothetical protein